MRTIPISATRSVKIADLSDEFKDHALVKATKAANPKATEVLVGLPEDATAEVAADIDEAVKVESKLDVYETWLKQKRTDIQNAEILKYVNKVTAPEKRKGGEVIRVKL